MTRKLDLALECAEVARSQGDLPGVRVKEEILLGHPLTRVEILDERGERATGKPVGTYLTLSLHRLPGDREDILNTARCVAAALGSFSRLPKEGPVLVAGLGNRQITPDILGPRTADHILATRHLMGQEAFSGFRPVAVFSPGVTGNTGMESGEILSALIREIQPVCLIAVDALAARRQERVFRTIQLSDTGIVPGSGVGNARMALDEAHLGIPVFSVGIPTVVDAATLCMDLLEGFDEMFFDPSAFRQEGKEWFVTPRTVDKETELLSYILGLGLNLGLHVEYSVEKVENFML